MTMTRNRDEGRRVREILGTLETRARQVTRQVTRRRREARRTKTSLALGTPDSYARQARPGQANNSRRPSVTQKDAITKSRGTFIWKRRGSLLHRKEIP